MSKDIFLYDFGNNPGCEWGYELDSKREWQERIDCRALRRLYLLGWLSRAFAEMHQFISIF